MIEPDVIKYSYLDVMLDKLTKKEEKFSKFVSELEKIWRIMPPHPFSLQ